MKELFYQFMNEYGMKLIYTALTVIGSYIGICIKNAYTKYMDTKTKKEVCQIVVNAIEQMYRDVDGKSKFKKAVENATVLLNEKGIEVNELEISMMIESTVNGFNQGFKEGEKNGRIGN